MDTYLIVLGLISLFIIIVWNPIFTEHMTNADLKKVKDFHKQKPGHWDINKDKTKKPILIEWVFFDFRLKY